MDSDGDPTRVPIQWDEIFPDENETLGDAEVAWLKPIGPVDVSGKVDPLISTESAFHE